MIRPDSQNIFFPSVTFVVVNWNQRQLTLDCLASLREQDYPNFKVVLIDNGSEDGSIAAVYEAFAEVTVLENGRNLGISGANNVGISYALESGSDYIFLLNNDTTVDPKMLTHLVAVAESDSSIGITGPTMLYFNQPGIIWATGSSIDWQTGSTTLLRKDLPLSSVNSISCQDVDFISTCAACIKRAVFETVGLMDERYFIYYDETDWFARGSAAGWRSVYVPWAKMWHKVSATMGESSPTTDYYMIRNNFLFLAKNLTGPKRILALARASFRNSWAIAAYTLKSHGGARLFNRNAKLLGMYDAALGRWGPMSAEVAAMCRPQTSSQMN